MCKGAEVQSEAFEKLEAKLRQPCTAWGLVPTAPGALGRCWQ